MNENLIHTLIMPHVHKLDLCLSQRANAISLEMYCEEMSLGAKALCPQRSLGP